ncbi:hypothetical protein BDY21DRAFT_282359 [Lineolata rhizophorae]|uniref:Ubiquitin thioesterase OTU n=1 Tax=Lineolata rhizophorae TaxID=578093 RepID=A0A6A6P6W5_9PEZI|nr:hypothetical protein BDY21DRAFT_282359 [Lineolata rhizophorae]
MRIRLRTPSSVKTLSLPETATVGDLLAAVSEQSGLARFDLKSGFPPTTLEVAAYGNETLLSDTGIKLDGEQLIVPSPSSSRAQLGTSTAATPSASRPTGPAQQTSEPLSLARKPAPSLDTDPPEVPVPALGATVVLRVMPDDNSCLFRAVSSALLSDAIDGMTELRSLCAAAIAANPDLYSAAVLQQEPAEYCRWIQHPDSWGGAIELGVLSQHFGVEIASVNVSDGRVDRFNEDAPRRCILVYSGIHYDTIAMSWDGAPPEYDVKVWEGADADVVLQAARELCAKLKERHYYTDTATFAISCNVCGWEGNGEREATEHAKQTGHMDFGEAG